MKVAIMGAGLSGLSCAYELERHGIEPVIFESRSMVGDRFVNGEIFLELLKRPITDCIDYFTQEYSFYLKPINNIKRLEIFSEHNKATLEGHLGYIDIRGRHSNSLENRLAQTIKSKIYYNSKMTYEQLTSDFSHVILAVGDGAVASKIQQYRIDLTVTLKGATITGNYDPRVVYAWLNNNFAPEGYSYLIPYNEQEANIVIAYPEKPGLEKTEVYWERFLVEIKNRFGFDFRITDEFFINNYSIGIAKEGRIGNTFFTGNCFGSIMPFLGFGQFLAILTGIYAARDIAGYEKYEDQVKIFRESYEDSLILRRQLEMLDNGGCDSFVKLIDNKLAKYLIEDTNINILKYISKFISPYVKLNQYISKN